MFSCLSSVALVVFLSAIVYGQQGLSVEPINPCAFTLCRVGTVCVPDDPVFCFTLPCPRPRARCIPVGGNRPGFCPALRPGSVGICVNGCSRDFDCRRPRKCCFNGCGRTCTIPVSRKPGFCPRRQFNIGRRCGRRCRYDIDCRDNLKCCRSSNFFCGRTCSLPVFRQRF